MHCALGCGVNDTGESLDSPVSACDFDIQL